MSRSLERLREKYQNMNIIVTGEAVITERFRKAAEREAGITSVQAGQAWEVMKIIEAADEINALVVVGYSRAQENHFETIREAKAKDPKIRVLYMDMVAGKSELGESGLATQNYGEVAEGLDALAGNGSFNEGIELLRKLLDRQIRNSKRRSR